MSLISINPPLTAEQRQARESGLTCVTLQVYLADPQSAAACQLELEQVANLFNRLAQDAGLSPGRAPHE